MAASHMLITTQTEARQLIRETLQGESRLPPVCAPPIRHGSANFLGNSSQ